jgi:hypothetical protein
MLLFIILLQEAMPVYKNLLKRSGTGYALLREISWATLIKLISLYLLYKLCFSHPMAISAMDLFS